MIGLKAATCRLTFFAIPATGFSARIPAAFGRVDRIHLGNPGQRLTGRGGGIMAVKSIRAPRPRTTRARSMAAMLVIVLHAHVGTSFSARAEDLEGQQVVDVSLITCGEFGRMPLLRALVLVGWVGGFYDGRKNDTKVEVLAFVDMAERVISLCRDNE